MRKAAFDSVVKQENDEKEKTSAITKDHGDRASDAKKALDVAHKQLDGHRRNGAPAARDSLRFVDTENEDYDGKKYGGRALAQLVTDLGMTSSPAEEAKEKRDFPDKNAKPVEDPE